ncbi:hypothetical protein, partial [Thiolapillus sp.]
RGLAGAFEQKLTVSPSRIHLKRCQPWRAKRRLVDPSSREASLFSRRALRQRENKQACLRPRDRFWDIPVPKIDSAFDNLFVPSRPGHQALRNNFASSLLLRTWLPMTGRRVWMPTLLPLWRYAHDG